jgi:hypothetical protein
MVEGRMRLRRTEATGKLRSLKVSALQSDCS